MKEMFECSKCGAADPRRCTCHHWTRQEREERDQFLADIQRLLIRARVRQVLRGYYAAVVANGSEW